MSKQQKSKPGEKTAAPAAKSSQAENQGLVFGRRNYMLMIAAVLVIVLGFILMYGDDQDIFSTRRITVAPITVLLGFVIGIFAIMHRPKPGPGQ